MGNRTTHEILESQIKRAVEAAMVAHVKRYPRPPLPPNDSKDQIFAIVLTLFFTLGPWGFSVPIVWACLMWSMAWLAFLYLISTLPTFLKWNLLRSLLAGVVVSAIAVAILHRPVRSTWRREKASATSGKLFTPRGSPADPIMIQLCKATYLAQWNGDNKREANFDVLSSRVRFVRNDDGALLINTEVRDHDDNLVVRVDDNTWTVPESMLWDKNYTDDALEVMDKRGRIVLQLRVYPDHVGICGEWWSSSGNGFRIADGPNVIWLSKDKNPPEPSIKPIFRYPSTTHWAEWVKVN